MLPFPIISNNNVVKTNTIIKYLKDTTGLTVSVVGGANILYNPSPFYYTDGYNAVRYIAGTSYIQVGSGGVPAPFQIGDSTNFKIETYLYLTGSTTQMLIGNLNNNLGTGSYWLTLNNTYQVQSQISLDGYSTTGAVQRFRFGTTAGSTTLPKDTWIKIKLERVGTLLSFYINDIQVGASQTMNLGFNPSGNTYRIGLSSDGAYQLLGAIDSFVISTS